MRVFRDQALALIEHHVKNGPELIAATLPARRQTAERLDAHLAVRARNSHARIVLGETIGQIRARAGDKPWTGMQSVYASLIEEAHDRLALPDALCPDAATTLPGFRVAREAVELDGTVRKAFDLDPPAPYRLPFHEEHGFLAPVKQQPAPEGRGDAALPARAMRFDDPVLGRIGSYRLAVFTAAYRTAESDLVEQGERVAPGRRNEHVARLARLQALQLIDRMNVGRMQSLYADVRLVNRALHDRYALSEGEALVRQIDALERRLATQVLMQCDIAAESAQSRIHAVIKREI